MTSDDLGGWDPADWSGFWYRVKAAEQVRFEGGDADAKCRELGLRDWEHLQRVRAKFVTRFGDEPGFTRAAIDANARHVREATRPPVPDCTLERYAEIAGAQLAWAQRGRDPTAVLARFEIAADDWRAITAHWMMQLASDAEAAMRYGELLVKYSETYLAATE